MKHFKRLTALISAFAIMLCFPNGFGAEKKPEHKFSSDKNVAEAFLDDNFESSGFSYVNFGSVEGANVGMRGGEYCWVLDPKNSQTKAQLNFIFSDDFKQKSEFDGTEYEFEIEYYDDLSSFFQVNCDTYGEAEIYDERMVFCSSKRAWSTLKFTVQNGKFNKELDGKYDFTITLKPYNNQTNDVISEGEVGIRKVTVTKKPSKNPIYVKSATTKRSSNSFEWYVDEKEVDSVIENLSDAEKTVNIRHRIVSDSYDVVFEKTEDVTFKPKESKNFSIDAGEVQKCGRYWYEVYVSSEDKSIDSTFRPIRVAILKTDPNGIKDDNIAFSVAWTYYKPERQKMLADTLALTNSFGARLNVSWRDMLNDSGEPDWSKSNCAYPYKLLTEKGMNAYFLIWGTSSTVAPGLAYREMPKTPEQLEKWKTFCRTVAEVTKGTTPRFEVWNEPNLSNFNYNVNIDNGYTWTKMGVAAHEAITEVNPNAIVAGPGVTGIYQGEEYTTSNYIGGKHFFEQAMEAGMWKTFDTISIHSYMYSAPEGTAGPAEIQALKDMYTAKGVPEPKAMITEAGYTTTSSYVKTPYVQGALNVRYVLYYKANNALDDIVCLYNYDRIGYQDNQRESSFGHVESSYDGNKRYGTYGFPRDSALMVTAMNYVMAKSDFVKFYKSDDDIVQINEYNSRKWDKKFITLHSTGDERVVTLKLNTDKVTYYDEWGNEQEVYGNNGLFTFCAKSAPVYILGDINGVEIVDNKTFIGYNEIKTECAVDNTTTVSVNNYSDKDYSIEAVAPSCAEVIETTNLKAGSTGNVTLKNYAPVGTEYTIKLNIKDGDKTVQSLDYAVESDMPVKVELECELAEGNDINRWKGKLKVKNVSVNSSLKGKIKFTGPSLFDGMGDIDIGLIPRGRTGEVEFNLPKLVKKGQYTFEYQLTNEDKNIYKFSQPLDFTVATYAEKKPTIDGVLEPGEWKYDSSMYADSLEQVKKLPNWKGADDLSGRSAIEWDEDNLYMYAEVTDDVFRNVSPANSNWNGDSIQFGVIFKDSGVVLIGQAGTTFHEIGVALSPTGPSVYRYLSQDNFYSAGEVENAEAMVKRKGNKTIYELKIPWKNLLLPNQQPKEGDTLGYSFLINEDDGEGRKGWIEYASGIGLSKDTSLFTVLKLIK